MTKFIKLNNDFDIKITKRKDKEYPYRYAVRNYITKIFVVSGIAKSKILAYKLARESIKWKQ